MLNDVLVQLYERDLKKLKDEIELYKNEADLWETADGISNSGGNLCLHITGGLQYLIGAVLGGTGYVRDRDKEFTSKGVERKYLVAQLEELITMINKTLTSFSAENMEAEYPFMFDNAKRSTSYVLLQLLLHLNYHLGQVNYLRRIFE